MAIEKRRSNDGKVTYRARLRMSGRPEMSATFDRRTDAADWEARTKIALGDPAQLRAMEARQRTVADAVDRYVDLLPALNLKDEPNRRRQLCWWRSELGHVALCDLTPPRIAEARDRLQTSRISNPRWGGPSNRTRRPATIVQYLAALSHVFSIAVADWGWLTSNPVAGVRRPRLPRGVVRYLEEDERKRLLEASKRSSNKFLYPIVVLALSTGRRRSEILSLRWQDVDLERGIAILEETKNGDRQQVQLVGPALNLLKEMHGAGQPPDALVFPGRAGSACDITTAWRTAVKRAGLVNFRFHDLRHTTGSYLAMRGHSTLEIGEVLGHKSPQMTKRYSHLSPSHTREILTRMVDDVFSRES